ncbi:hypothetical protein J3F84DRAFT_214943 [Trichoderma pleuroticola]
MNATWTVFALCCRLAVVVCTSTCLYSIVCTSEYLLVRVKTRGRPSFPPSFPTSSFVLPCPPHRPSSSIISH